MPISDSPRVIYQKNPLQEVICQLRFPPILKIDSLVPFEFQDRIRNYYPLYSEVKEGIFEIPEEISRQIPAELANAIPMPISNTKNYKFSSSDEKWNINLTNSFVALTTPNYVRWEDFRNHFDMPMNALVDFYKPSFFSRVGLRYVNVINKTALGLYDIKWSQLIQPYLSGILSASDINPETVKNITYKSEFNLEDDIFVRMIYGLRNVKNENAENKSDEIFLIDNDFYINGKMETHNGLEIIDRLNIWSRRLFRWCITDKLHQAMVPLSIDQIQ